LIAGLRVLRHEMICTNCGSETPAPLERCFRCATPFPSSAASDSALTAVPKDSAVSAVTTTFGPTPEPGASALTVAPAPAGPRTAGFSTPGEGGSVVVGETFGRYQLIRLLGS